MATLVIMVLDDVEKLEDVMHVWRRAGAGGVTILASSGAGRLTGAVGSREDFPLLPSLRTVMAAQEVLHRTLFTVLEDDVDVEAFFDATEQVVGRFDGPFTGVIMAVPVLSVRGANRRPEER